MTRTLGRLDVDEAGGERDEAGGERDEAAHERDQTAWSRDQAAWSRDRAGDDRDQASDLLDQAGDDRDAAGRARDRVAQVRDEADELAWLDLRDRVPAVAVRRAGEARHAAAADRSCAAQDRRRGAGERRHALQDRDTAQADRAAGAVDRDVAEHDRDTAQADRVAGAGDRDLAEHDRSASARDTLSRADLARDKALLYARQQHFSQALQFSLLTAPPQSPTFQIAVRYLPATSDVQVGGDWYDAFVTPSGATVLAIGDVVGHDVEAAATMGQLRSLLRGLAFTTEDGPAAVLARLESAIQGLGLDTMATAVLARLDHDPTAGAGARLTWANAGHPPAVLVHPDGEVELLAQRVPDLLLGVDPSTVRGDHVVDLAPGGTVLLYTDGLVERRGADLDHGIDHLATVLRVVGCEPLEHVCDQVLAQLVPLDNEDDIALLAIRMHP